MAKTTSVQTYTSESGIGDLAVISTYTELMKASMAKDSVYVRAKENIESFFRNSNMAETDKAAIFSKMLTDLASSITNQAMTVAVGIAKENREGPYAITKLREETLLAMEQRDKVAAENIKINSDINNVDQEKALKVIQGWKLQSDMKRDNGAVLNNLPDITVTKLPDAAVADKGIKWETEQQTKMSVYATLAKSYRESGVVSWTVDGGTGKINGITDLAPATPGLTKRQEEIAIRQKTGFDDNMVQHAANSSANMIGLLLSAEESGNITVADVDRWRAAVDYLKSPSV